jgi:hypothetical protein
MYQNKIIKVFLREYYRRYSITQREVGRLIKPSYGKECQLRKEYCDCCPGMKYGNLKKWTTKKILRINKKSQYSLSPILIYMLYTRMIFLC